MLSFGLKTQRGGKGWYDVGTVSAVGWQLRSALCVAPPPERRDLRSVSRLSMSWSRGAPLWSIWHMLPDGVDRREAIPTGPKASHDTGYTYVHDKGCYDMQQWNATVASGLVAGVATCNVF